MKGIFISQAVLNKNNGGGRFVNSLIELISLIVGKDNLRVVALPSQHDNTRTKNVDIEPYVIFEEQPTKFQKIRNVLAGCPTWISKDIFDKVVRIIKNSDCDFVFLGFSTYGYLIKRIKRETKIPVFVMYHGVTPNTKLSGFKSANFLGKVQIVFSIPFVYFREKTNAILADCNIILNNRDSQKFYNYYKKNPDLLLPIFLKDSFSEKMGINPGMNGMSLLFVGSYFGPNIAGLDWFVERVMGKLPPIVNLYIVGQGMSVLSKDRRYARNNIHVVGEVDNLSPWYYHADIVVEPIFEGDGMKTKTVEAMMYGKVILGTDEAFCGYEGLDDYCCNTSEDFVNRIKFYIKNRPPKMIKEVREIFLQLYSDTAVMKNLRKKMEELCLIADVEED